jgi:hypothetical protein
MGLAFSKPQRPMEEQWSNVYGYDRVDRLLVGPGGALPPELRRALLGVGNRKVLRFLFYKPLVLAYRFVYLIKNRKSARKQFETA